MIINNLNLLFYVRYYYLAHWCHPCHQGRIGNSEVEHQPYREDLSGCSVADHQLDWSDHLLLVGKGQLRETVEVVSLPNERTKAEAIY